MQPQEYDLFPARLSKTTAGFGVQPRMTENNQNTRKPVSALTRL